MTDERGIGQAEPTAHMLHTTMRMGCDACRLLALQMTSEQRASAMALLVSLEAPPPQGGWRTTCMDCERCDPHDACEIVEVRPSARVALTPEEKERNQERITEESFRRSWADEAGRALEAVPPEVKYDAEAQIWIGHCPYFKNIAIHGDSEADALEGLSKAIANYLRLKRQAEADIGIASYRIDYSLPESAWPPS